MMLRPTLAMLLCAAGLAGCAQAPGVGSDQITTGSILPSLPSASALVPTTSQSTGLKPPERVSGNLYRIDSSDRKITDPIQRENYALLRAAEGTKQLRATHFTVVRAEQSGGGLWPQQQSAGPTSTLIRVLQLPPGAEAPEGAVAADEIIHFFGPNFGRTGQTDLTPPASPASPPVRG